MTRTAVQRLVRRLAAVAAGLGALAIVETQLHRYYYGQTYRYYDAAEVYWEDQNTLLLYLPHPTLFWSLRPGITMKVSEATRSFGLVESHNVLSEFAWEIRVGPKGFRGPDFPADKPEGEIRVVCFGDSRTIGEGLEEGHTYPARLEAALRRSFRNRPVRVINAGADGWSSHQGLKLLNDGFARYRPDFAVFAFGINDADTDWGVSDRERALRAPAPLVAAQRLFYR